MDQQGTKQVTTMLRKKDQHMPISSWMDPENFNPSYLMRSMDLLPKCGNTPEWQHTQDYWSEKDLIPEIDLSDEVFVYK